MVSSVFSSSSSISVRHVRSISLPSRSNPSTLHLEVELADLKTWEAASASYSSSSTTIDTVCGSLSRLERLYESVNDLLCLPQTQRALTNRNDDKLVEELLDRSVTLLDICGSIKDVMEQVKEHIRNVQSALRRKKEGLNMTNAFSHGKLKDVKRTIFTLKQIDNKIRGVAPSDLDDHLSFVIRSLRDTSALSASVFGSLLSLTSVFVTKPKVSRWSVVSNLIHKEKKVSVDHPRISNEDLESDIEVIEKSLESMFRTMIKTRVSLLNILSH